MSVEGDPYFITYISDGTTVVRRFRGDCQGWVQQAALTTVAGATEIVPLPSATTYPSCSTD